MRSVLHKGVKETRQLQFERTAGFLNLLFCGGTCEIHRDLESLGDIALSENLDLVGLSLDESHFAECGFIDLGTCLEVMFQLGNINDGDRVAKLKVAKAALWKSTVKGHLTTFEAGTNATAGAGFLSLVAFAGSLTVTGALSATKALFAMLGTRIGLEIV